MITVVSACAAGVTPVPAVAAVTAAPFPFAGAAGVFAAGVCALVLVLVFVLVFTGVECTLAGLFAGRFSGVT